MKTLDLKIEGMTCGNCVRHVRQALEGVPGVEVASVEIGAAQIRVEDSAENTLVGSAIDAIDDAGYRAAVSTAP